MDPLGKVCCVGLVCFDFVSIPLRLSCGPRLLRFYCVLVVKFVNKHEQHLPFLCSRTDWVKHCGNLTTSYNTVLIIYPTFQNSERKLAHAETIKSNLIKNKRRKKTKNKTKTSKLFLFFNRKIKKQVFCPDYMTQPDLVLSNPEPQPWACFHANSFTLYQCVCVFGLNPF